MNLLLANAFCLATTVAVAELELVFRCLLYRSRGCGDISSSSSNSHTGDISHFGNVCTASHHLAYDCMHARADASCDTDAIHYANDAANF